MSSFIMGLGLPFPRDFVKLGRDVSGPIRKCQGMLLNFLSPITRLTRELHFRKRLPYENDPIVYTILQACVITEICGVCLVTHIY